ncbi:MAG: hypothetical protein Q9171_005246 [Xanthocarpia ochracea]
MITIINQSLWTLSAFVVAYIFYTAADSTLRARRFARIHGCRKLRNAPQKDPFFGVDVFLDGQKAMREKGFLQYLSRYFEEYGSTFKWNLMGDALIFTNEPKNLQAILATKFSDFDIGETRQQITKPFWGVGIFNSDGPLWAHSRALIRPNFTRELVSDTRTYDSHVSNLISRVHPGFVLSSCDSTNCLRPDAPEEVEQFVSDFAYAQRTVVRRIRMGKFAWLDWDPGFGDACNRVHSYVKPFIERDIARRHSSLNAKEKQYNTNPSDTQNTRYCFLDELVKEENDSEHILGQVLNILVAGRDTTASLLSSLFFTLSRRSDVMAKLREEVSQLDGQAPTYDDIKGMKYLNWAIKETLRMYSVVPMNTRNANKDTVLPSGGGLDGRSPIFVRKGQMIVYQSYSLHRRSDLWGSDSNEFKPERW